MLQGVFWELFSIDQMALPAYIYFSGKYDNHAKNYIAVKPGDKQAILKKNGIVYHIWAPVDFLTLL